MRCCCKFVVRGVAVHGCERHPRLNTPKQLVLHFVRDVDGADLKWFEN
jgi:hypothetical protein